MAEGKQRCRARSHEAAGVAGQLLAPEPAGTQARAHRNDPWMHCTWHEGAGTLQQVLVSPARLCCTEERPLSAASSRHPTHGQGR